MLCAECFRGHLSPDGSPDYYGHYSCGGNLWEARSFFSEEFVCDSLRLEEAPRHEIAWRLEGKVRADGSTYCTISIKDDLPFWKRPKGREVYRCNSPKELEAVAEWLSKSVKRLEEAIPQAVEEQRVGREKEKARQISEAEKVVARQKKALAASEQNLERTQGFNL